MKKINCSIVKDLLPLYVDGVVSEESVQLIRAHLDACESCHKDYEALKRELVLPTNPTIQEESSRVLKDFRHKWKMKKIAIVCISVILTSLVFLSGYMVYENVSAVHDYITPTTTVILRDVRTGDEWQRIDIEDTDTLTFDSIFCSKKATLDANSDSAISFRICDSTGVEVLGESVIQPGESVDLTMLKRNTEYIVEVKADIEFAVIRFY